MYLRRCSRARALVLVGTAPVVRVSSCKVHLFSVRLNLVQSPHIRTQNSINTIATHFVYQNERHSISNRGLTAARRVSLPRLVTLAARSRWRHLLAGAHRRRSEFCFRLRSTEGAAGAGARKHVSGEPVWRVTRIMMRRTRTPERFAIDMSCRVHKGAQNHNKRHDKPERIRYTRRRRRH